MFSNDYHLPFEHLLILSIRSIYNHMNTNHYLIANRLIPLDNQRITSTSLLHN